MKELHVWNYKTGLNNKIYKKINTVQKHFFCKNTKGSNLKNCTCETIKLL